MRRVGMFLLAGVAMYVVDAATRFLTETFDKIDEACRLG